MSRSQLHFFTDIAQAPDTSQNDTGDLTFEEFQGNQMRIDAVISKFVIIGLEF